MGASWGVWALVTHFICRQHSGIQHSQVWQRGKCHGVQLLGCRVRKAPNPPHRAMQLSTFPPSLALVALSTGLRLGLGSPAGGQLRLWEPGCRDSFLNKLILYLLPPYLGPAANHQILQSHLPTPC